MMSSPPRVWRWGALSWTSTHADAGRCSGELRQLASPDTHGLRDPIGRMGCGSLEQWARFQFWRHLEALTQAPAPRAEGMLAF